MKGILLTFLTFLFLTPVLSAKTASAAPDKLKIVVLRGDTTICNGGAAFIAIQIDPKAKVSWTPTGAISCDTCTSFLATPSMTTRYKAVVDSAGVLDSVFVTVTVLNFPVLTGANDTLICQGQSVVLGKTVRETGVNYGWLPTSGLTNPNDPNTSANPQATTRYILRAANGRCVSTDTVLVEVVPISVTITNGDTARVCLGDTVKLSATAIPSNAIIRWTPSTGLDTTQGNSVKVFTALSRKYVATVTNLFCVRHDTVYVRVDSLPSKDRLMIMPKDTMVCKGDLVYLTSPLYEPADFPDMKHRWTPRLAQLTPDSSYNMVIRIDTTRIYTRITMNGACVDTQTAKITTNEVTEIKVTPQNPELCDGESVQLKAVAPGATEFEWQNPTTGLSCVKCDNPVASPAATTTYTVKAKFGKCPISGSVNVIVYNIRYRFPTRRNVCQGEQVILNELPNAQMEYTWTATDPNFGTVKTAAPAVTPQQTTTYYVTFKNNKCEKKDSLTIVVTPTQTLTISKDTTICQGGSARLSVSASGTGGSFSWTPGGATSTTINVQPGNTTSYQATYTYGPDCKANAQVTVTVRPLDGYRFPTNRTICPGAEINLNENPKPNDFRYTWTATDPAFGTRTEASPLVKPARTTTYYMRMFDGVLCEKIDSLTIVVAEATMSSIRDTTICPGTTIVLNTTASTNGLFRWTSDPAGFTAAIASPNATPAVTTNYFVSFNYGPNCFKFDTVKVTVLPDFTVSIDTMPAKDTFELGAVVMLTAKTNPAITGATYSWELKNGSTVDNAPLTTQKITVKSNAHPLEATVTVKTPQGCTRTAKVVFSIIEPEWKFPNVFIPSSETESNRFFNIVNIKGEVVIKTLRIFNRWGQLVYDNENAVKGWDGRYKGEDQPSDTYMFYAELQKANGQVVKEKGEVNLLR